MPTVLLVGTLLMFGLGVVLAVGRSPGPTSGCELMVDVARPVSPLARVVDLGGARAASDADVARRLHQRYAAPLARARRGDVTARGLPFRLGGDDPARQWLLIDRPVSVDVTGITATHVVLFQFCDLWRDAHRRTT